MTLSVSFIDDLECDEVRDLGVETGRRHRTAKQLFGWAVLRAEEIRELGLRIERDDNPPRHANILDWPDDSRLRKEKRLKLARHACPVPLPTPILVEESAL